MARNFNHILKELRYKFASMAAQANPSSIISGDLITADNESPLINTLYHNFQGSHLNSTLIKIQQVLDKDNQNRIPLAVA